MDFYIVSVIKEGFVFAVIMIRPLKSNGKWQRCLEDKCAWI